MAAAVDWPPPATHSTRGGTSRDALAHVPVLKEIEQRQAVTAGLLGFNGVSDVFFNLSTSSFLVKGYKESSGLEFCVCRLRNA